MNTMYANTNGKIDHQIVGKSNATKGPDPSLTLDNAVNGCDKVSKTQRISSIYSAGAKGTNSSTYASAGDASGVELKIIGHLRSIERISEKSRPILNDQPSSGVSRMRHEWGDAAKSNNNNNNNNSNIESFNAINGAAAAAAAADQDRDAVTGPSTAALQNCKERVSLQLRSAEQLLDSSTTDLDKTSLSTNCNSSLSSPPPKPPMLGRHRSIGSGKERTGAAYQDSCVKETELRSTSPIKGSCSVAGNTTALVTAATIAVPAEADTIHVAETPVLRRVERPKSLAPTDTVATAKQISINHYERLIEELKCPGCAFPMKGQVLLCKTGHSICAQCTRVLMLCPLCKEPFTNIRSLTVEALCSKAHFRCANASGGCTVRLQIDLLNWHEKQCIYKPMKCFMGRVYGDCSWSGREANWKEHLETNHADKVFTEPTADLVWDMSIKQKPLTGYYVFQVYDEMFNFYEVYDKERVLFTMSCTSTLRERKLNFAFEVTAIHTENEALAITQKFPVHSEYDKDILMDGTCVSISLADLAKFIDSNRLLHYRVRVLEVKSPRKTKASGNPSPNPSPHPLDFQNTKIEGVNLKHVPADVIVTRKVSTPYLDNAQNPCATEPTATTSSDEDFDIRRQYRKSKLGQSCKDGCCNSDSDPEFEAFVAKKWGTPQMHFNRKYLNNPSSESSSAEDSSNQSRNRDVPKKFEKRFHNDVDKVSLCSTNTSYKKKVTNSLRKSFRSLKTDIIDLKPFGKKSSPRRNATKFNA